MFPSSAHAACFNPAGNAGDIRYYGGFQTPEYCNGGAWVPMGPVGDARTGLVGWWKLDETSGTSAADSSGTGNTGTLHAAASWTTGGMNNGALTLNGTTQYMNVADAASLQFVGDWTISEWVNFSALPSAALTNSLLERDNGSPFYLNYGLWIMGSSSGFGSCTSGRLTVIYQDSSAGYHCVSDIANASTGIWYHVTGTYVSSSKTLSLYINGSLVNSAVQTLAPSMVVSGALHMGYDGTHFTNGTLDDARVYNRALTAQDIHTLYTSTGPLSGDIQTGLTGYWKFDESSGTVANDSTGNGNTGTLAGTTLPTWGAGKINNALTFNGVDDEVDVPSASALKPGTTFTVAAWVKPTSTSDMAVVKSPDGTGFGTGWRLTLSSSTGVTTYITTSVNGNVSANVGSTVAGQWSHVAFVYDGNFLTAYLNGVAGTPTPATGTVTYGASDVLKIGKSSGVGYFSGTIDDVRVYSRALSQSDVLTLYNTYATACASPAGYAGDLIYNGTPNHVPQFCNDTNWVPLGPVPGAGGVGCSSPTGGEGDIRFSSNSRVTQYCDGATWVATGGNLPLTGLVGWWNFDEGSGTSAADFSSGNGNTGTLQNSPTWTTSGQVNGALTLNGTNQYVSVPDVASLDLAGSWTISAWVNANGLPGSAIFAPIVERKDSASKAAYVISIDHHQNCPDNGMSWRVHFQNSAGTYNSACYASTINTGTWYHVTGVWDSSSSNLMIYLNGVLVGTQNTGGAVPVSDAGTALLLGKDASVGWWLNGTIDDVRIYNRALSASEVWRLFNGAS